MKFGLQSLIVGSFVSVLAVYAGCSSESGSGSTTTSSSSVATSGGEGGAGTGGAGAGGKATGGSGQGGSGQGGAGTGGTGQGGGGTGGGGGAGGGGSGLINGCSELTATDMTAMSDVSIKYGGLFNYSPPCVKVKTGTKVTFSMDFTMHPLVGGTAAVGMKTPDPNSPIKPTSTGMSVTFTMDKEGTYGFYCDIHAPGMAGAVFVTQ